MATTIQKNAALALQLFQAEANINALQYKISEGRGVTVTTARKSLKTLRDKIALYGGDPAYKDYAAALLRDPATRAEFERMIASIEAQNASGGIVSAIGNKIVDITPTALKIGAAVAVGDFISVVSGGGGFFGADGSFSFPDFSTPDFSMPSVPDFSVPDFSVSETLGGAADIAGALVGVGSTLGVIGSQIPATDYQTENAYQESGTQKTNNTALIFSAVGAIILGAIL